MLNIKMVYIMQVKVYDKKEDCYNWVAVKCSDGRVYEYPTKEEAINMLNICYPEERYFNSFENVRVTKQ